MTTLAALYFRYAWLRLGLRLFSWLALYFYFAYKIEFNPATMLTPRITVFAGRNLFMALFISYGLVQWLLPTILRKKTGFLLLPIFFAGSFLTEVASLLGLYRLIIQYPNLIGTYPDQWRASYAAYVHRGFFTFLWDQRIFSLFFYRYMAYFYPLALKLTKDSLLSIYREGVLTRQTIQFELNYLKSRINPAFLLHTLGNIESLAARADERAPEVILKLSDLMRYTLYETNTDLVPLKKEIGFITKYIDLEQNRLEGQVTIDYRLLAQEIESRMVPPLLLFPFVERAFLCIHTGVSLSLDVTGDRLTLQIEADQVTGCRSESLENARKRLTLAYPKGAELTVRESPQEYRLFLQLPLNPAAPPVPAKLTIPHAYDPLPDC